MASTIASKEILMNHANFTSEVVHSELCSLTMVRRVAAMLDLFSDQFEEGMTLPRGWQFILLAGDTQRSKLRSDGFPGLGVSLPDLGLPRLLQTGRTVKYYRDIVIGSVIRRRSLIANIEHKSSSYGPMAIVTLLHQLVESGTEELVLEETQTYVMLSALKLAGRKVIFQPVESDERSRIITPDETMLFQYCALCFNSHKIHLNREYAREVEGFPDLVVNGGLITLLMTEFMRLDLRATPVSFSASYLSPLYCDRPITLTTEENKTGWTLKAHNETGQLAAKIEVVTV
jgi:3-methylfumaryl-CoA hydratase